MFPQKQITKTRSNFQTRNNNKKNKYLKYVDKIRYKTQTFKYIFICKLCLNVSIILLAETLQIVFS